MFDDVAREDINVRLAVSEELGPSAGQLNFASTEPFAAGSFAQVYRADYAGQPVIVKVLRPSIARHLGIDLAMLRIATFLASPLMYRSPLDLASVAREFIATTRREVDYQSEVRMAQYFKQYFASRSADIIIPATYSELSTPRLIVQEYIEGLALTDVIEIAEAGGDSSAYVVATLQSDLDKQLATVGRELLTSVLQADYVMSDPHPGNILLLPGDKVALIDFGLVSPAPAHRSAYFGMIQQYRTLYEDSADLGTLAIAMLAFYDYELYQALRTVNTGEYAESLRYYIARHVVTPELLTSQSAARRQITSLFLKEINAGNRFGVVMNSQDIVLQKAMHSLLATIRLAYGEHGRTTRYWRTLHAVLVQAERQALREGVRDSRRSRAAMCEDEACEIIVDWLSTVAERDPTAYRMLMKGAAI